MKTLLILTTSLFSTAFAAHLSTASLFKEALVKSVPYALAQTDFNNSNRTLERTQSDPLATKNDVITATAKVQLAKAQWTASRLAVRLQLATDLSTYQMAQSALEVATLRLNLTELALKTAQVKFNAGATTRLDLDKAQDAQEGSKQDLEQAKDALEVAKQTLISRTGVLPKLDDIPLLKPTLEVLKKSLSNHPQWIGSQNKLKQAQLSYSIKQADLSPAVEVDEAKSDVEDAEKSFQDIQRELNTALENAWSAYQGSLSALGPKTRALELANRNLKAQKERLDKGIISRQAFIQVQLEQRQAENTLESAYLNLEYTLIKLAQASNLDLWEK